MNSKPGKRLASKPENGEYYIKTKEGNWIGVLVTCSDQGCTCHDNVIEGDEYYDVVWED